VSFVGWSSCGHQQRPFLPMAHESCQFFERRVSQEIRRPDQHFFQHKEGFELKLLGQVFLWMCCFMHGTTFCTGSDDPRFLLGSAGTQTADLPGIPCKSRGDLRTLSMAAYAVIGVQQLQEGQAWSMGYPYGNSREYPGNERWMPSWLELPHVSCGFSAQLWLFLSCYSGISVSLVSWLPLFESVGFNRLTPDSAPKMCHLQPWWKEALSVTDVSMLYQGPVDVLVL